MRLEVGLAFAVEAHLPFRKIVRDQAEGLHQQPLILVLVDGRRVEGAAGGGIVTAPNIRAFAEGLRTMMSNAAMRLKMGGAARAYCSQRHSRTKILDLWETLLQNVGCGL